MVKVEIYKTINEFVYYGPRNTAGMFFACIALTTKLIANNKHEKTV